MSMKVITGDIIKLAEQGKFDVIIHGCNCEASMGAGLALQIKESYPDAAAVNTASKDPKSKLGGVTGVSVESNDGSGNTFTILNGYTQLYARNPGGLSTLVDYDAIRSVFKTVAENFPEMRIAYPKIGAGRARGDWDTIKAIIEEELKGCDHTLVDYAG